MLLGLFGCPSSGSNTNQDPAVILGTYLISVNPFPGVPTNFNKNVCQPFSWGVNNTVQWWDLLNNQWMIEITMSTVSSTNAWNKRWQLCGGNAVFNGLDASNNRIGETYQFSLVGQDELRMDAPKNRFFNITCKISTMCLNCNTQSISPVSYVWSTSQKQIDGTALTNSGSLVINLGPLQPPAFQNAITAQNPCPCY